MAAWNVGAVPQCRSPNAELNFMLLGLLAVHHALSFQVHMTRCGQLLCTLRSRADVGCIDGSRSPDPESSISALPYQRSYYRRTRQES